MNGTLNKVMLIGYLGEDVKMHYAVLYWSFDWLQTKSISTKLLMKNIINRVALVVRNKAAEMCEKYLTKEIRYMLRTY
jgi:single-strand DNA-binding protein